jgi:putative nucleotidyltransferase with HDIG domain
MNIKDIERWFGSSVNRNMCDDEDINRNIELKKDHSLRVREIIRSMSSELEMGNDDIELAEIVALLHDIGRFEQYRLHMTFNDHISVDHALLGVEILEREDVLKDLSANERRIVNDSILNHNKAELKNGMDKKTSLFSKLLRDADKVDILHLITRYYIGEDENDNPSLVHMLPDTPGFSKEVYNDIANKRIVDNKNVRNINDLKLLHMGWAYDINFWPACEMIIERKYLEKILCSLPMDEAFQNAYEMARGHLMKRQKIYI